MGEVTGYLHECRDTLQWMTDQYKSWLTNGGHYNLSKEMSGHDIVAEYSEPQPQQPLRWVENAKPDKPGIWAVKRDDFEHVYLVDRGDLYSLGTWCYIGPMPEILPPMKKVVQRLWLERLSSSTQDGTVKTVFAEHWIPDDGKNSLPAFWIATPETREVTE